MSLLTIGLVRYYFVFQVTINFTVNISDISSQTIFFHWPTCNPLAAPIVTSLHPCRRLHPSTLYLLLPLHPCHSLHPCVALFAPLPSTPCLLGVKPCEKFQFKQSIVCETSCASKLRWSIAIQTFQAIACVYCSTFYAWIKSLQFRNHRVSFLLNDAIMASML